MADGRRSGRPAASASRGCLWSNSVPRRRMGCPDFLPLRLGGLRAADSRWHSAVLSLSALCAVALAPNRGADALSVTAFVPGGFVLTVASALVWGLAGGAAGIGAWSTRTASLIGLGLLVGTTGAISWRRGGRVVVVGRDAPALTGFIMVSAFFTWVVITQPFAWWSRINGSGTDFLRHLSVVRAVRSDGSIQPGSPSYPKALHALVAWLANAMGLPTGADPMWRAAALAGFLMLALMLLAVMAVATRATIAISGSRTAGVLAGVVGGLVFVQTAWFSSFLAFGSVMNMLVAVCLLTLLLSGHQVGIFGSTTGTILCGACLAVTANSWQLLIPVVGLAAMPWMVQFLRLGGWRRPGTGRSGF